MVALTYCAYYGQAEVIHKKDPELDELYAHFSALPGARQIFAMTVDLVQNSYGMSVHLFSYEKDRNQLKECAIK